MIRIKGSHHIFTKIGIKEVINIQPIENNKAKPYQVKPYQVKPYQVNQIRNIILKYKLGSLE